MIMIGSVLRRVEQNQNQILEQGVNTLHENRIITKTAADLWEHWAIMPCHDKKLEASRKDFVFPIPEEAPLI